MAIGLAIDLGDWFSDNQARVRSDLGRYFGGRGGDKFSGRWFETFASMSDPHRFAATDILAVEALSVSLPSESAAKLLVTDPQPFNDLLTQIPVDLDLWEADRAVVEPGSAAHDLHAALDALWKVGWVTAGKLVAAKRPRLIPILDKEVKRVLKPSEGQYWVAMHGQLSDPARRAEIARVCANAPSEVSLLRRIDVALWMYATQT